MSPGLHSYDLLDPVVSPSGDGPPCPIRQSLREDASFQVDDARMRELVRDLQRPKRIVFWMDLSATSLAGWTAFAFAVLLRPLSPAMLACTVAAALALYRALCFLHEISHQNHRTLPGFETAWNLLAGYPLLMPSFVYVGVHQSHHKLSTYGTSQDPEYLPFAHNSRMTAVFALEGFFIPAILLARFLLLTPIGFLSPRFERWLVVHLSSLTMNVQYRRDATPELVRKVRLHSAAIFAVWASLAGLSAYGILPWRFFAVWFVVTGLASFVNTIRTLGAHAYESSGEPLDRVGQLIDSIDTPGALWTELWAPVGLRYHALHHYFPGIPYHNLAEAYRRLISTLAVGKNYGRMSSPSLQHSLRTLYKKGLRAWI
jgi:fatty acid desaturase